MTTPPKPDPGHPMTWYRIINWLISGGAMLAAVGALIAWGFGEPLMGYVGPLPSLLTFFLAMVNFVISRSFATKARGPQ